MQNLTKLTRWHELFALLLEWVIGPTGILVQANVDVSSTPPEIDILLIQNLKPNTPWTTEQLVYLPDGIRQSNSPYILLEFKYTESISIRAAKALIGYEEFFRRSQHLEERDIQSFLVSAHQPQRKTREMLGYTKPLHPGVYGSTNIFLARTHLIVLSELDDAAHNAFFKLFAHQQQAKKAALEVFARNHQAKMKREVQWLILGLLRLWDIVVGEKIMRALTKEDILKYGEALPRMILPLLTVEELMAVMGNTPLIQHLQEEFLIKGREEGREEGREHGLEEGLVQGLHSAIELGLELKFGAAGLALWPEIAQITQVDTLKALQKALKTATSLAEIRQIYQVRE